MASIDTAKGRIGAEDRGASRNGEMLPILFLHGVGSDKSVWAPQLDHFSTKRRTIALDYPGYGDSDPAPDDCTRDDYAAAVVAAMDSLGVDRAHICGLSLGGVVAIALHDAAPDRCASLILADSFAVHPDGQAIFDRSVAASENPGLAELAKARAPMLLAPDTPEEVRDDVIATMARIDPAAYRIGARAVWLADQQDRAARIGVPTLVLVGTLDPVTPPALSKALADCVAGAKLEQIEGASHIANLDRAGEFNRLVDRFISEVERNN